MHRPSKSVLIYQQASRSKASLLMAEVQAVVLHDDVPRTRAADGASFGMARRHCTGRIQISQSNSTREGRPRCTA